MWSRPRLVELFESNTTIVAVADGGDLHGSELAAAVAHAGGPHLHRLRNHDAAFRRRDASRACKVVLTRKSININFFLS